MAPWARLALQAALGAEAQARAKGAKFKPPARAARPPAAKGPRG